MNYYLKQKTITMKLTKVLMGLAVSATLVFASCKPKDDDILKSVNESAAKLSNIGKPDKLYLDNTNLMYALAEEFVDVGTLRETFFANQLSTVHQLTSSDKGDFKVNSKYVFEIGGKNKSNYQIAGLKNAYIASDDIETGALNKIPLWLFGFLY